MNICDWLNVVFFLLFVVQMQSSMAKQEPAPMVIDSKAWYLHKTKHDNNWVNTNCLDFSPSVALVVIECESKMVVVVLIIVFMLYGVLLMRYLHESVARQVCVSSLMKTTWLVTEFVFWWSPVCYEGSWFQGWQKSFGWSRPVAQSQKSGRYELNKYTRLKAVNLSIKK